MVLGLRSSERREKEKERERERIRGSILKFTKDETFTRMREEKYSRFYRLTLAPRQINYCSINNGG